MRNIPRFNSSMINQATKPPSGFNQLQANTYTPEARDISKDQQFTNAHALSEQQILQKLGYNSLDELPPALAQEVTRLAQAMPNANVRQNASMWHNIERLGDTSGVSSAQNQSLDKNLGFLEQHQQNISDTYNPYTQAGNSAFNSYNDFMGTNGQEAQAAAFNSYQTSPAQQFALAQSEKALKRNAAALGGLGGGNVRKALSENALKYNTSFFNDHMNRLAGVSDVGMNAGTAGLDRTNSAMLNMINLRTGADQNTAQSILGAQQQGEMTLNNQKALDAAKPSGLEKGLAIVNTAANAYKAATGAPS